MKLVTYITTDARTSVGALTSDEATIVDLSEVALDMLTLIRGGDAALDAARRCWREARATQPLAGTRLLAPLPVPEQIRDGMMFETHIRQAMEQVARMRHPWVAPLLIAAGLVKVPAVWYRQPLYYKANRFSVVGPDADIIWPKRSRLMDFECELGCVVGRRGKDLSREQARACIFGYTIFNDFSARDLQGAEMRGQLGPAKGKDFDTGNAMGPVIVTADAIEDVYALRMTARVNGDVWGEGSSDSMHHRFEDLLAHVSRDETIQAGEFFGSGTVGNGCGLEHGRFLADGDVVELEIEGIGVLRNRVRRQKPA